MLKCFANPIRFAQPYYLQRPQKYLHLGFSPKLPCQIAHFEIDQFPWARHQENSNKFTILSPLFHRLYFRPLQLKRPDNIEHLYRVL
jgi:hypothetical protein